MKNITKFLLLITALSTLSFAHLNYFPARQPAPFGDSDMASPWLEIDPAAYSMRIFPGHTAKFEGRGKLIFRDGRSLVIYSPDLELRINGNHVTSKQIITGRHKVSLADSEGKIGWTVEMVTGSLPDIPGITISDSKRSARAVLETKQQKTFYLKVDEEGMATFFEPKIN